MATAMLMSRTSPDVLYEQAVNFRTVKCAICLLLILACKAVIAQVRINPNDAAMETSKSERARASGPSTMKCEFRPIEPVLDFAQRYEAGYALRLPLGQFQGKGHRLEVLLRFEAESGTGRPFYRTDRYDLKSPLDATAEAEISGQHRIDSGVWRIEAVATLDDGRDCSGQWKIHVEHTPEPSGPRPGRATVLLDAAPLNWRATTLQATDIAVLCDTVSALTERMRKVSVRLIIFNSDLEVETAVSDCFTTADAPQLAHLMELVQPGVVDSRRLQTRIGPAAFLARLIQREAGKAGPEGRLIFLGPVVRPGGPVVKGLLAGIQVPLPAIFYLQFRELGSVRRFGNGFPENASMSKYPSLDGLPPEAWQALATALIPPDTIENLMRQLHGQTIKFSTPREYAQALNRVARARAR